jgi:hypothetical protein
MAARNIACPSCDGTGEGLVTRWWPAIYDGDHAEPESPRSCEPCGECKGTGDVPGEPVEEPLFRTDEMDASEPDVPLATMLVVNAEDEYVCDWLRSAEVGDVLNEVIVVTRVA